MLNWLRNLINEPVMPKMKPFPQGASLEVRKKYFVEYVDEIMDLNRWYRMNSEMAEKYKICGGAGRRCGCGYWYSTSERIEKLMESNLNHLFCTLMRDYY